MRKYPRRASRISARERCVGVTGAGQQWMWRLIGADGESYDSPAPGTLGGHRRNGLYGGFDCPSALRAIARGGYVTHRVLFANEQDAIGARLGPCTICLPDA